jgi:phage-related protein
MSDNPEEIRAEIERTRAALSDNVNELVDEANPKNIAKRKVNRVKEATLGVKDKIMGSASDAGHSAHSTVGDKASSAHAAVGGAASSAQSTVSGAASSAQSAVSDAASTVSGAVSNAPQQIRRRAEGNPLAAGLIAFGAGMLVSSLLPASQKEQQAVEGIKENIEPMKQQVTEVAKEAAQNLQEPLQEAAQSVKATAQDAVQNVKDEGTSAAADVKQEAQDSGQRVRETRQS